MLVRCLTVFLTIAVLSDSLVAQTPARSLRDSIQFRFVEPTPRPGLPRYQNPYTGQSYVLKDIGALEREVRH